MSSIKNTKETMQHYEYIMEKYVKKEVASLKHFVDEEGRERNIYHFATQELFAESLQELITPEYFGVIMVPDEPDAIPLLSGSIVVRMDRLTYTETYNLAYAQNALMKGAKILTPQYRAKAHSIGVGLCL